MATTPWQAHGKLSQANRTECNFIYLFTFTFIFMRMNINLAKESNYHFGFIIFCAKCTTWKTAYQPLYNERRPTTEKMVRPLKYNWFLILKSNNINANCQRSHRSMMSCLNFMSGFSKPNVIFISQANLIVSSFTCRANFTRINNLESKQFTPWK